MKPSLSTPLRAALFAVAVFGTPAQAGIIYQSAIAGGAPSGGFVVQGDGTTDGSNILGGVFTLTANTFVTDIGGNFLTSSSASGGGDIFGEIVQIPAGALLPNAPIELLVPLARVTFAPTTDGDTTVALPVLLGPGTYAVLFGGNATDAPGFATFADNNTPTGLPSLFEDNFGAADPAPWDNFAAADLRVFVESNVPEPESIGLFGAGLAMLAMLGLRVRRRA